MVASTSTAAGYAGDESAHGPRFAFGRNWRRFLSVLDDERIGEAERSLRDMLEIENLSGQSFLDVGSGSGLFSLAARRLGARVHSFDYDPESVACTQELKRRYFPEDPAWRIERGSILDGAYVRALGSFDIVYSWGVLHHTGAMWTAIENAALPVLPDGRLVIAIYNDQGVRSRRWRRVKKLYCSGKFGQCVVLGSFIPYFVLKGLVADLRHGISPLRRYREYKRQRGMSLVHDWIDWLGGFPFEVARPEDVFAFCQRRGFILQRLTTCGGGGGCNQFVFWR
jgi:2-polyprenyl-3-methyl-5-hydroxy-6-metoxy-1,4-benzoquinol methylase